MGGWVFKDVISKAGARGATANPLRYFELLEERDALVESLETFLSDYDGWICPVATTPAFPHRAMNKIHTPIDVDGQNVPGNIAGIGYTCGFNLTGHPVVTVPVTCDDGGLPIGIQIVGRLWDDIAVFNTAEALEEMIGVFQRPPGV